MNAKIKSKTFIADSIAPGEKGKKEFKITEIPLVPPSKSERGNINATVDSAYSALPTVIRV
jgi:hypothetical protein